MDTLSFKRFYVFFIIELFSRRIVQTAVTTSPTVQMVQAELRYF
ncbi:MAG: hypothetical protein ACLFUA_09110 [Spirochaetales bacterium]